MRRQLLPALRMLGVMTLLTGFAYTAAVTLFAQGVLGHQADGSLVERGDVVVGSEWLGQTFETPGYFDARPSAHGVRPQSFGCLQPWSNSPDHLAAVEARATEYREINGLETANRYPSTR